MAITQAQKIGIQEVIKLLLDATVPRGKRRLADMFLELVDKDDWPEYYEVIPEPRCLNGVKQNLKKNKYDNPLSVYEDLNLVFLNALYYNEEGSQISKDATTLKTLLDSEWKQRYVLPAPRASPPPSSAQKVHEAQSMKTIPPRSGTSKGTTPAQPRPSSSSTPAQTRSRQPPTSLPPPPPPVPSRHTPALGSPDRHPSPDMDVDVGGTPEPENQPHESARDGESDEIVRQLEKGLPRWEGFAGVGWTQNLSPDRWLEIVQALSEYQDGSGNRPAVSLELIPEEMVIPDLSFNYPLSFALVQNKARAKGYESSDAFDKEMSQLFLKGRRLFEIGTEPYGNILTLQRLYQALTSSNPPAGPPFSTSTFFASLRAGPGTAKPLHAADTDSGVPGVTTFRVSAKDRTFVETVEYKGWSVKLADWLHLSNPDDPSRPIIAQVFKCWVSDETSKKGQPGVTVCWYYRPEQTWHPAQRQFWEREVFKTSHFADHPLEDIIEKIACQFTARHVRGRPRPPFWYPGWPLYVCDSRYNDRERLFVKIKNWNSCVPEEVRKSTEFMPIYPFERSVFPRRFSSPFLGPGAKTLKAPGGLGDVVEKSEGDKIEGGGTGRKRPRRAAASGGHKTEHTDRVGQSKGLYVGSGQGSGSGAGTNTTQQPPQTPTPQPRAPIVHPRAPTDRSIVTAAGGMAALGNTATIARLPPETAKHFDRDPETNEVLWFAAPPVDIPHPTAPRHSIAYLHYLAKKRKTSEGAQDVVMDGMDDPGERATPQQANKRARLTTTEMINSLLEEYGF